MAATGKKPRPCAGRGLPDIRATAGTQTFPRHDQRIDEIDYRQIRNHARKNADMSEKARRHQKDHSRSAGVESGHLYCQMEKAGVDQDRTDQRREDSEKDQTRSLAHPLLHSLRRFGAVAFRRGKGPVFLQLRGLLHQLDAEDLEGLSRGQVRTLAAKSHAVVCFLPKVQCIDKHGVRRCVACHNVCKLDSFQSRWRRLEIRTV
jgi:hypothetical protein